MVTTLKIVIYLKKVVFFAYANWSNKTAKKYFRFVMPFSLSSYDRYNPR